MVPPEESRIGNVADSPHLTAMTRPGTASCRVNPKFHTYGYVVQVFCFSQQLMPLSALFKSPASSSRACRYVTRSECILSRKTSSTKT